MLLATLAASTAAYRADARPPESPSAQRKPKKPPRKPAPSKPRAPSAVPAAWHPSEPATVEPPRPITFDLAIDKTTLPNGLRVVLNPEPALPVIALAVAYAAGPKHETQDQQGFAAAAANAMSGFGLSPPSAERLQQLAIRGASLSTVENTDQVVFLDLLPAGALEFGLWFEAERMLKARVTEQALEAQRRRVRAQDQHAMSLHNLAAVQGRVEQLAFEGFFPYEHDCTGQTSLASAPVSNVEAFRSTWYVPENAVIAITGAFDPELAMRAVHRFFRPVPRSAGLPVVNPPPLPDQTNQRSAAIRSELTNNPVLAYGWAVPAHRQPEHDALGMAASILGEGPDSRIVRKLAKARLPVSIAVQLDDRTGPSLLLVALQAANDASLLEARKIVDDEVDALARLGPTTDEMRSLWRDSQQHLFDALGPADQRALRLASLELLHGDARLVYAEQTRPLSISKDDIRKAVARFLSPTRRSMVQANATGRVLERPVAPSAPAPTVTHPGAHHASAAPGAKRKPHTPAKPPAKKRKKK